MEAPKPIHDQPVPIRAVPHARLQFSVRDLLIATTVVSICLAFGVHFAGFTFVVVVVGIVQITVLLAGDWLIRPQNRRALAFASAGSWATLGSGFLVLSLGAIFGSLGESFVLLSARIGDLSWWVALGLGIGAATCYGLAAVRWRQLTQPQANQNHKNSFSDPLPSGSSDVE
jgi:hypothetical protein